MKYSLAAIAALVALASAAPARSPAKRQCAPASTVAPPPPVSTTAPPPVTSAPPPPVSTAAPPPPTTTAPPTSGGGGGKSGSIFSVYADIGITADAWPKSSDLGDWNDLVLAFFLSDGRNAFDISAVWEGIDNSTKTSIINDYHSAGKKIRVSVFGSTDAPLSHNGDPVAFGNQVAQWVKDNQLDGVDVDYEDSGSFNANGDGENYLISLTKTLRAALPSPQYFISHAPQSPYFTSNGMYPKGAYNAIHAAVGDQIDFYNVQYYNQGAMYEDCTSLFQGGGTTIAGTSVGEMIAAGIPAGKIIVGKPSDSTQATNGIMDPATLGGCISAATTKPGGVMSWQWSASPPSWIAAAKGDL